MQAKLPRILVGLVLLGILFTILGPTVYSVNDPYLTTTLTSGKPIQTSINGYNAIALNYTNTMTTPILAVIWASVQNQAGQTVATFVSTNNLPPGQTAPAVIAVTGLLANTAYTARIFALTTSGVPISTTSTLNLQF